MPFIKNSIRELSKRAGIPLYRISQEMDPVVPYSTVASWLKGTSPRVRNIDELYRIARNHGITDIEFYQKP